MKSDREEKEMDEDENEEVLWPEVDELSAQSKEGERTFNNA